MNFFDFINNYSEAFFVLFGGIVSGLLVYFREMFLKKKEYKLKLLEKLIDKRIEAHEEVIKIVDEIKISTPLSTYSYDVDHRIPRLLISKDNFREWNNRFNSVKNNYSIYFTKELKNELDILTTYFSNLLRILDITPDGLYDDKVSIDLGLLIRDELYDFSDESIKIAMEFFNGNTNQVKIETTYDKNRNDKLNKRFKNTILNKNLSKFL